MGLEPDPKGEAVLGKAEMAGRGLWAVGPAHAGARRQEGTEPMSWNSRGVM